MSPRMILIGKHYEEDAAYTRQSAASSFIHPNDLHDPLICYFLHNSTLLHYRVPNVTGSVTSRSSQRTSENAQKPKFAEFLFHALR